MKIEVFRSQWASDHGVFPGGVHELTRPKAALVEQIGAAAALSDPPLKVVEASKDERARMKRAVQSQAEGEKAYEAAQRSGDWHGGNYDQFMLEVEAGLRDPDQFGVMPDRETYIAERKVS